MTTISGNNMTTPTGIEMVEFPLRRNGLRKKARRDHRRPDLVFGLWIFSSAVGNWGEPDKALPARRTKSMAAGVSRQASLAGGSRWLAVE